jgi:hypothetical protein
MMGAAFPNTISRTAAVVAPGLLVNAVVNGRTQALLSSWRGYVDPEPRARQGPLLSIPREASSPRNACALPFAKRKAGSPDSARAGYRSDAYAGRGSTSRAVALGTSVVRAGTELNRGFPFIAAPVVSDARLLAAATVEERKCGPMARGAGRC